MRFIVTDDIFETFPDVRIGVLVLRDLDNRPRVDATAQLEQAQAEVRAALFDANVAEHPRILCWREAYRAFGAKPKKYASSIENLVRRSLKGETLRPINPLVDLYNVVSLKHLLPVGGEDLDTIEGDIRLTRASANEPAVRLLGESDERAPKPGEVVYTDDRGAICRRWNWKEADRTKLTEATKHAVVVIEALPPVTRDELDAALAELEELAKTITGAAVTSTVLDREHTNFVIDST